MSFYEHYGQAEDKVSYRIDTHFSAESTKTKQPFILNLLLIVADRRT